MTDEVSGAPSGTQDGTPAPTEGQPQGNAPATPQRPEHVPEKFWDAETGTVNTEALLASYSELEKARSKPQEGADGAPADEGGEGEGDGSDGDQTPPEGDQTPPATTYEATVQKAEAELTENGALTEETYADFEKQGISRERIDQHLAGQAALFELRKIHVEREVGGEDAYASILAWAGSHYTAEEAEAYNKTVFGADKAAALAAAKALKQRYEDAMGTDGKIVTDGTGGAAPGGYASRDEWRADLRNPEYKKSEAFRANVRKKLEVAMKNGVNLGVGVSVG